MRRLSGVLLAGALFMLPAFSQSAFAQEAAQQQQPAAAKVTYTGDAVVIAYNVMSGKDADYEQVIAKLKAALGKSESPERKQQAAGWKIIKASTPQPDGSSVYLHIISPVVRGADYSITNIVYETSTDEEKVEFYNLYRGALKGALFQVQGPVTADMSK